MRERDLDRVLLRDVDSDCIISGDEPLKLEEENYKIIYHLSGIYILVKNEDFKLIFAKVIPYTAVYYPQEYTTPTPTFDPKILEKMDFGCFDRTPNSASCILKVCVCQLQTSGLPCKHYFSHINVITSSNNAYLSLQTHQLFEISAVIGNRFTIVKLQFKCHALCTCQ